jgi:hypothetical protein
MHPDDIQLGPLTRTISDGAKWLGEDKFPAWQEWADEVEQILQHTYVTGRFARLLPRLRDVDAKQRDSNLAEARASFFFHRNGFSILGYNPPGANGNEGDLLIQWGAGPPVFVEVKAPSWRGELFSRSADGMSSLKSEERQWIMNRLRQPKDINLETRWINPAGNAIDVIERNALKKFHDDRPNLVVLADDFFVTPVGLPTLDAIATAKMSQLEYNRLGGILFFKAECYSSQIEYRIQYVDNPTALPRCHLPEAVRRGFLESTAEAKRLRRRRGFGAPTWVN